MSYEPDATLTELLGDVVDLLPNATDINRDFENPPANLSILPGQELYLDSELQLDTDGWTGPAGKTDPTHQGQTSLRYADGAAIDVLLRPAATGLGDVEVGVHLGDYAVLLYDGRWTSAVFADFGPPNKIGEASLSAFRNLGKERIKPDGSVRDVGMGPGIVTIVFPGSGRGNRHFTAETDLIADMQQVVTTRYQALRG